ncbi:hypothetical protein PtB15_7B92 [Puccinia triticina]|nr:hypothetical protein PtB15_7B92 [Puccinia triticina]
MLGEVQDFSLDLNAQMTGEPLTNSERIQEGHSLLMLPDPFQQDRPKQTRPKDVHFFVLSAPLQKRLCQLSAHPRTDVQAARDEHPIDLLQQSPGTDTFVGTPGRVNALICDGLLKCNTVCTFVLEECDKMLKSVGQRWSSNRSQPPTRGTGHDRPLQPAEVRALIPATNPASTPSQSPVATLAPANNGSQLNERGACPDTHQVPGLAQVHCPGHGEEAEIIKIVGPD